MVAKTPLKEKRLAMALNPNLVRETVQKVDKCMARLQELQRTVTGGAMAISGVNLRTGAHGCRQGPFRLKNAAAQRSPAGKFQGSANGEWRRMSLPAMLLDETVLEILQASKFAKEIAAAAAAAARPNTKKEIDNDPKTPDAIRRTPKRPDCQSNDLRARRTREKKLILSSEISPLPRAARSRIAFKPSSPLARRENTRTTITIAQRVSPKNRPWAKKTVLFPNPIFLSSSSPPPPSHVKKRHETSSLTPHKFLIKSPPASLKAQMKSKKAVPAAAPLVFSPVEKKLASSKTRRCSFSPSKLASRLSLQLSGGSGSGLMSGLKQRHNFITPMKHIPSIKRK